jgi:hypothetical protein
MAYITRRDEEAEGMEASYYVDQQGKLLREFEKMAGRLKSFIGANFEGDPADQIIREFLAEYESIIPEIPYIGGDRNSLSSHLIQAGWGLAIYRAMKRRGKTLDEAGDFIYRLYEAMIASYPRLLLRLSGWLQFTLWQKNIARKTAVETQKREYPDNFVMSLVEGDGQTFDHGYDYTECAILKFMQKQGVPELTSYLCACDIPKAAAAGTGLERTTILALGGVKCDFRFKRGRETPTAWPPQT